MNWIEFIEAYAIDYVTRGPNTKKGEISVRCPWCGDSDPSHHMGISLATDNWGCHRNPQHRGKAPTGLIAALLGCNWHQAKLIAAQYSIVDPDSLGDALAALTATSEPRKAPARQALAPPPMRPIEPHGLTAKFWRYMAERGFDNVQKVTDKYKLTCCLTGVYKDRIIIPFYQKDELVAWTGRAIVNPILAPRYLTSSGDALKKTIFNEDELYAGGKLLFLVEGPFDAIKMDYYGAMLGARTTCVFGTSMTMDQIYILNTLRKRFSRVVILFDQDALEPSFYAADWLNSQNVIIGQLPKGVKDPGEMRGEAVKRLVLSFLD